MTRVFPLLLACALLAPSVAAAQDEAASKLDGITELMPNQQAFLNLPEERRRDFINHLSNASRLFQQKRIFESMDELGKASTIFPDSPELHNLRGSCYVEMRSFDKALDEFKKASGLSRNNPSVEFNIGEVYFVTKEWQKSLDTFEGVLKKIPESNMALSRLVEFKILLCMKKLGRNDDALILSEKYDYLDDSPFHYYAKAAFAYDENRLTEAEQWLARAARIFRNVDIIAPWQDTLVEYGYIKSFYGEEAAETME